MSDTNWISEHIVDSVLGHHIPTMKPATRQSDHTGSQFDLPYRHYTWHLA